MTETERQQLLNQRRIQRLTEDHGFSLEISSRILRAAKEEQARSGEFLSVCMFDAILDHNGHDEEDAHHAMACLGFR